MTIMVDDAGTGDLIGDAFIIFWRSETDEILSRQIPLEIYQSPDFFIKVLEFVKTFFIEAIESLKIPDSEEIILCQGNLFDKAREYLTEIKYKFQSIKIEGAFQNRVEQFYLDYLSKEFNIPKKLLTLESGKKRFFNLFNWVTEDFPRRVRFVKSGFEKWQTKWEIKAQEIWMMQMAHGTKSQLKESMLFDDDNGETQESNNIKSSFYHQQRPKVFHKNPRYSHIHPKSDVKGPRKKFNKSLSHNSIQKNPHRTQHRKYSSTDPDPRRKFF